MDIKLKQDWIDALRSGKYVQGHSKLYSDGKYCCLGVLCRVAGIKLKNDDDEDNGYKQCKLLIGTDNLEPFWARNDGFERIRTHTFPEIADYIEETVPTTK